MDTKLQILWTEILTEIEKEVSRPNFLTLFKHATLVSLANNTAIIAAPSIMIVDMLQKRFSQTIKKYLDQKTAQDLTILYTTQAIPKTHAPIKSGPLFAEEGGAPAPSAIGHLPRVRQDYTFQNFAVSGSNQLAFVSAQTVAKNIGHSYNPFFIYGPVGVGKTHLMHAIANDVYFKTPEKKIIYITSEEFTNDVVQAIRSNDTAKMKKKFRSAFLLLIDDIQFIEGKEKVQEELFHTFNILIDQGSQICLSSDRPPHEIKKLEKRLSSRFAGGLTVDIALPDFELKTAILLIKSQKYGFDLPIDIAKRIAETAQDTRSLEGLLLRVITQAAASGKEITPDIALKALGADIPKTRGARLHTDDIIEDVCAFYNIKSTQLKGPKRDASLVRARQVAMYLLKDKLKLTYTEIGNVLGGRDHTTIMHGVDKIEHLVQTKATIIEDIMGITQQLLGEDL